MQLVTRSQWGAAAPRANPTPLPHPKGIAIHYEGSKLGVIDHSRCAGMVKNIQSNHQSGRNSDGYPWNDIAYNDLVCQHGVAFEGRGAGVQSAANGSTSANKSYWAICILMGPGDTFTAETKQCLNDLIDKRRGDGAGNEIQPHRHFIATACPGQVVVDWLNSGRPTDGHTPTPPPTIPVPTPNDWLKELVNMLPTLNFNDVNSIKNGPGAGLVDNVQGLLNGTQFDPSRCAIDNTPGPGTLKAVKAFQKMKGLSDDGIVGRDTWTALITH